MYQAHRILFTRPADGIKALEKFTLCHTVRSCRDTFFSDVSYLKDNDANRILLEDFNLVCY